MKTNEYYNIIIKINYAICKNKFAEILFAGN